jgi:circadian clock protein KaiB
VTEKKIKPEHAAVLGDVTESFEAAMARSNEKYELRLYVAGQSPRSKRAIATITGICDEYLKGRYDLEVIDIYQDPGFGGEIIAAPTLVKALPAPLRRLIGDMSDRNRVLIALNILPQSKEELASKRIEK